MQCPFCSEPSTPHLHTGLAPLGLAAPLTVLNQSKGMSLGGSTGFPSCMPFCAQKRTPQADPSPQRPYNCINSGGFMSPTTHSHDYVSPETGREEGYARPPLLIPPHRDRMVTSRLSPWWGMLVRPSPHSPHHFPLPSCGL